MFEGKRFKLTYGILAIAYLLLGVLLVMNPLQAQGIISYILGGMALLLGIVLIAFYFVKDETQQTLRSGLAGGIVLVAAGFYLFAQPLLIWALMPVLLGFIVLYDSVVKLQSSLELKGTQFKFWWIFLLLALATAILGLVLVVFAQDLGNFFGIILLACGVVDLVFVCFSIIYPMLVKGRAKREQKQLEKTEKLEAKEEARAAKEEARAEKERARAEREQARAPQSSTPPETEPVEIVAPPDGPADDLPLEP